MNARIDFPQANLGRNAGRVGAAALVLSAVLLILAPAAAVPAYRFAAFACLQPALGSLIFALIYRITGGQWGESLLPYLRAGIRLVPWIWPLIALLALVPAAYPGLPSPGPSIPANPPAAILLLRAAIYEGIFLSLRWVALRDSGRSLAAPGLIVLVYTLHFLAADWFFTLEPGWYSSGFPLVWMSIQATAGLSWAILLAAGRGLNPAERGSAGRSLGLDWGNLLLTTVIFSSYVAFVEFLIIWSGNLPREISWFLRRDSGVWRAVIIGLALFHLGFPLGCMLLRPLKASRTGVPRIAALLCVAEIFWAAWFILPSFGHRGILLPISCAVLLAGAGGLFLNRYLAAIPPREAAR
jgi:hypothetical protein